MIFKPAICCGLLLHSERTDVAATHIGDEIDILNILTDTASMVEKDIHIVARLAGIPLAGCRDADHAN